MRLPPIVRVPRRIKKKRKRINCVPIPRISMMVQYIIIQQAFRLNLWPITSLFSRSYHSIVHLVYFFEIMFNSEQNEFLLDFLRGQEGSQITTIPNFTSIDGSSMTLKREYSYEKALHFPAGPKSTTCYVAEVIKRKDPDTYYEVISSIRTPNVPSGGSFSTKTRYLIRWNDEITCLLRVSFWVEWTGSSWIKGMVENGCKNGQLEAAQLMERILSKFIENNVEECQITISKEEEEQDDKEVENKLEEVDLEQPREAFVTAPQLQSSKVSRSPWKHGCSYT